MARIERKYQKIFAGAASNNGQFGSAQVGTKVLSNDLDTIQALAAFVNGWNDATISGQRLPALEEMQGLHYMTTSQIAYLFQEGIPEWDTDTTYYKNSIVRKTGTYQLYGSLTDDNQGNALTVDTEWLFLTDLSDIGGGFTAEADIASATTTDLGGTGTNVVRITGTTTITGFGSGADVSAPIYLIRFAAALTLTHNGTSLILPGGANITTAAGDSAMVQYLGSGNWKVLAYTRANGEPLGKSFRNDWPETTITDTDYTVLAADASKMFALDAATVAVELKLPDTSTISNGFSILVRCEDDTTGVTVVDFSDVLQATMSTGRVILFVWNGTEWLQPLEKKTVNIALHSYTVAVNTAGFTVTTGGARTIPFNTTDFDPDNIAPLSANQVTLGAGTYEVDVWANLASYSSNMNVKWFLYNVTDGANIQVGATEFSSPNQALIMNGSNKFVFTITAQKVIEYRVRTSVNSTAFPAANLTEAEVYAQMLIKKVA